MSTKQTYNFLSIELKPNNLEQLNLKLLNLKINSEILLTFLNIYICNYNIVKLETRNVKKLRNCILNIFKFKLLKPKSLALRPQK